MVKGAEWNKVWTGVIWTAQQSVQPNGAVFEKISRSPGSRLLFVKEGKILLSREKRAELGGKTDHRLPGGKVFDKNDDYQAFLSSGGNILDASRDSAAKEALEEVGMIIEPHNLVYLSTDVLGATCSWDLIYWVCSDFKEHSGGAQFYETEADEIEGYTWMPVVDACKLVLDKEQFSESRSAIALISYAASEGYVKL